MMKVELVKGDAAPAFELVDQAGRCHRLEDYKGRWLVLYFYPKDDTSGCTKEACTFRDCDDALQAISAQVVGISLDKPQTHARFVQKYRLPFPLLSDTDARVAAAYGALRRFGPLKFARRHTFIIDPQGRIAKIYRHVKPATHSREVMEDLKAMQDG